MVDQDTHQSQPATDDHDGDQPLLGIFSNGLPPRLASYYEYTTCYNQQCQEGDSHSETEKIHTKANLNRQIETRWQSDSDHHRYCVEVTATESAGDIRYLKVI